MRFGYRVLREWRGGRRRRRRRENFREERGRERI